METVLLPGEPEDAIDPADVRHWAAVYVEMVHSLIAMSEGAATPAVASRLRGAEERLRWWLQREAALARIEK